MTRMLTKEQILMIPKLKEEGLSSKKIADKFGVSYATVQYWIKRLRDEGIEVKNLKVRPLDLR